MNEFDNVQVFTTGQVARICQVAPRTVSKWFDTGRLKGYRIPGSQDRRIPRQNLLEFMQSHGMPLGVLAPVGPGRVMLVCCDKTLEQQLQRNFQDELEIHTTASAFEAGSIIGHIKPHCVVVNLRANVDDMSAMTLSLRRMLGADIALVVMAGDESLPQNMSVSVDEVFRAPVDANLVATRIHQMATRMAMKVR